MLQIVILLLKTQTVFLALNVELVVTTFTENGLCSTDKKATFTPHLTISKTTKTSGKKRIKMIDPKCYEEHRDDCFGVQPINTLELLSMTRPPDRQGYYHCYGRETFGTHTTQNCPEYVVDTGVKQSTHNGQKENQVLSVPCTAVPRVLLTKEQVEPATDTNTNTDIVVPSTDNNKDTIDKK